MKKRVIIVLIIVVLVISGIFAFSNIDHKEEENPYAPYEYLIDEVAVLRSKFSEMFSQNQETFASIAEQLYMTEDTGTVVYDTENKTVKYTESFPQNMDKALFRECFEVMDAIESLSSVLDITKLKTVNGTEIRFTYRIPKIDIDVGIMYSEDDSFDDYEKLCDNWYIFQYGLV